MESYAWNRTNGESCLLTLVFFKMLKLLSQHHRAFNACRIPASPSDYAVKTAETDQDAQHFIIVKKNRFYSVPVCDESGQEFGVDQLRAYVKLFLRPNQSELTRLLD